MFSLEGGNTARNTMSPCSAQYCVAGSSVVVSQLPQPLGAGPQLRPPQSGVHTGHVPQVVATPALAGLEQGLVPGCSQTSSTQMFSPSPLSAHSPVAHSVWSSQPDWPIWQKTPQS